MIFFFNTKESVQSEPIGYEPFSLGLNKSANCHHLMGEKTRRHLVSIIPNEIDLVFIGTTPHSTPAADLTVFISKN